MTKVLVCCVAGLAEAVREALRFLARGRYPDGSQEQVKV